MGIGPEKKSILVDPYFYYVIQVFPIFTLSMDRLLETSLNIAKYKGYLSKTS